MKFDQPVGRAHALQGQALPAAVKELPAQPLCQVPGRDRKKAETWASLGPKSTNSRWTWSNEKQSDPDAHDAKKRVSKDFFAKVQSVQSSIQRDQRAASSHQGWSQGIQPSTGRLCPLIWSIKWTSFSAAIVWKCHDLHSHWDRNSFAMHCWFAQAAFLRGIQFGSCWSQELE